MKRHKGALILTLGLTCQGCYRIFDHDGYLEVDHIRPTTDGGGDEIGNLTLLCTPCNRSKSNVYSLSGLRKMNKKHGLMG